MASKAKNMFAAAVDFSLYVENQALLREITPLEALRQIMDELEIEDSEIKPLISESLKQKLFRNGCELGCMRGASKSSSSIGDLFE